MRTETKNPGGVEYSLMSYEFCPGFKIEPIGTLSINTSILGVRAYSVDDKELTEFRKKETAFIDSIDGRFDGEPKRSSLASVLGGYEKTGITILGNFLFSAPIIGPQRVAAFVAGAEVAGSSEIIPAINNIIGSENLVYKYLDLPSFIRERSEVRVEEIVDKIYFSVHPRKEKRHRFIIAASLAGIFREDYQILIEGLKS